MSRSSPEATFATAQAALARGDWDELFACLDTGDLQRIVKNGLSRLSHDAEVEAAARAAGVDPALIDRAKELAVKIGSAATVALSGAKLEGYRLKDVVDEHRDTLGAIARSAPDLVALTAGLERAMRRDGGGGSVSSTLFTGETLETVHQDGATARGAIRTATGAARIVVFARRKAEWKIRLFAS